MEFFDDSFDILGDTGSFFDFGDTGGGGDGLFTSITSDIFDGDTLGDTVGTAGSLLGLAQKASGALSGVLGGGGGSGESKGFVPQKNTELAAAKDYQSRLALQQTFESKERSDKGQRGNPHSVAIVRELLRRKPDGVKAAGNALMSVASTMGSRAELRARATA